MHSDENKSKMYKGFETLFNSFLNVFFFFYGVISKPNVGLELKDPKIKSRVLRRLSQPGSPRPYFKYLCSWVEKRWVGEDWKEIHRKC